MGPHTRGPTPIHDNHIQPIKLNLIEDFYNILKLNFFINLLV